MTPEQMKKAADIKRNFRDRGLTISQWSRDNGFDPRAVMRVIRGTDRAYYGNAHQIAVKLGMKKACDQTQSAA